MDTRTIVLTLAAAGAGAIGASAILPSAEATEVDVPACTDLAAEGVDCAPEMQRLGVLRLRAIRSEKRAKVIRVFDHIRTEHHAVWSAIMAEVAKHWDEVFPPPAPEPVEPE